MRCAICEQEKAVTYKGIYENEVVDICPSCQELEELPIIKRPTKEQLQRADQRYTVRQTMEKLSGINKEPRVRDLSISVRSFSKLKIIPKPDEPDELIENYNWKIKIARRRLKMSVDQLSKRTNIQPKVIEAIEKGQLPKNYTQIIPTLEAALGITILKERSRKVIFHLPEKTQEKKELAILEAAKENIKNQEHRDRQERERQKIKKQIEEQISTGKFDFSKRKNIEHITLNDLVELKRKKEKLKKQQEEQEKELLGDELDIKE